MKTSITLYNVKKIVNLSNMNVCMTRITVQLALLFHLYSLCITNKEISLSKRTSKKKHFNYWQLIASRRFFITNNWLQTVREVILRTNLNSEVIVHDVANMTVSRAGMTHAQCRGRGYLTAAGHWSILKSEGGCWGMSVCLSHFYRAG